MALAFSSHGTRWQHLNDWLFEHRELWQPTPFTDPAPVWTRRWPELARQLAGFSDADCEFFEMIRSQWQAPSAVCCRRWETCIS